MIMHAGSPHLAHGVCVCSYRRQKLKYQKVPEQEESDGRIYWGRRWIDQPVEVESH